MSHNKKFFFFMKKACGYFVVCVGLGLIALGNFQNRIVPPSSVETGVFHADKISEVSKEAAKVLAAEAFRRLYLGDFSCAAKLCERAKFLNGGMGDCKIHIAEILDKKIAVLRSAAFSHEASGLVFEAGAIERSSARMEMLE